MLTASQLKKIMPNAGSTRIANAVPILNAVAKAYDINNERRLAAWLATLAVESGELKYQEELASGAAYEGRKDLGNTQKGDGRRFKGHGRIQITGRDNHTKYTAYLKKSKHLPFVDFVAEPHRLAEEPYATDAAGWFWTVYKKLNQYADRGDFLTTQVRVNGRNKKTGLPNHWRERSHYFARALSVLPDDFSLTDQPSPVELQPAVSVSTTPPDTLPIEQTDIPPNPPTEEQPANTSAQDVTVTDKSTWFGTKLGGIVSGVFTGAYVIPQFDLSERQMELIKLIFPYVVIGLPLTLGIWYAVKKWHLIEKAKLYVATNTNPHTANMTWNEPSATSQLTAFAGAYAWTVLIVFMIGIVARAT